MHDAVGHIPHAGWSELLVVHRILRNRASPGMLLCPKEAKKPGGWGQLANPGQSQPKIVFLKTKTLLIKLHHNLLES